MMKLSIWYASGERFKNYTAVAKVHSQRCPYRETRRMVFQRLAYRVRETGKLQTTHSIILVIGLFWLSIPI